MGHRPAKSSLLREYERARKPSLLGRIFRERHLYLRGDSGVRFIVVRPWTQAAALFVLLAFTFWTAYATVNTVFKDQMLTLKDRKIASERQAHAARMDQERRARARERAALQSTIRELNAKLMADQDAWLRRVDKARKDFERLEERQKQIRRYLDKTGLLRMPEGGAGHALLARAAGGRSDRGALHTASLARPERSFRVRFARPFHSAAEAEHVLDLLREMGRRTRARQIALLERAAGKAGVKLAAARAIYRRLGLDPVQVAEAEQAAPSAVGGPFIPLDARDADGVALMARIGRIEAILGETGKLKRHVAHIPVVKPMKHYTRISSRFGYRSDPFRHRLALHGGIDFKAAYGAPIYATAPGVVTRAGWTGSYGRLVEIRHDNGLVTRYAHQSRVLVHTGQRVRRGEQIGKLGNTGRSTGAHLHYETRVNGKPVNPGLFWKAGHDLSKIKIRG